MSMSCILMSCTQLQIVHKHMDLAGKWRRMCRLIFNSVIMTSSIIGRMYAYVLLSEMLQMASCWSLAWTLVQVAYVFKVTHISTCEHEL
jgi:hypothetical protein